MKTEHNKDREWEEELKNSPELLNKSEGQPFQPPAGYFDGLASSVMDKIAVESTLRQAQGADATLRQAQGTMRPLFSYRKLLIPSLAIAAILIVLFIFGRMRNDDENKLVAMNYDDIYNSGLVTDLDESFLVETLAEETTSPINSASGEIENYLIDVSTEDALMNNL